MSDWVDTSARAIYKLLAKQNLVAHTVSGYSLTMEGDYLGISVSIIGQPDAQATRTEKAVWLRLLIATELNKGITGSEALGLMMANATITVTREGSTVDRRSTHI